MAIDVQVGQTRRAARRTTLKNTTRHDGRSVSAGTTRWWAVFGPRSRHVVSARTRHEKWVAHLKHD
jgi:hypothetical protein